MKFSSISKQWTALTCSLLLGFGMVHPTKGIQRTSISFSNTVFLNQQKTDSPTPAPTASPTISPAPTLSHTPTMVPTVSLAPSSTPTLSAAPSANPTKAPSMAPTPAPTPSPSVTPTISPSVSIAPSTQPSVSAAPSTSPTKAPTDQPSTSPSDAPSMTPSISMAPSGFPTTAPTESPSVPPTPNPTSTPSEAPSDQPSAMPSVSPTTAPTITPAPTTPFPSAMPSSSPTKESYRTKTGVTSVSLEGINKEMYDLAVAEFEVATLQFLQDAGRPNPFYTLEMMAVTVLDQEVVGDRTNSTGLEVTFRAIGLVTSGVAPTDFDIVKIVKDRLSQYFSEFLHRLTLVELFFEPLGDQYDANSLTTLPIPLPDKMEFRNADQFVTSVFSRTMKAESNVFLKDILTKLEGETMMDFELATMMFIRDTYKQSPDYSIDIVSVSIIQQDVMMVEIDGNWTTAGLQVDFRTVGIVSNRTDFTTVEFVDAIDEGFKHFYGEYLHRLTRVNPFFAPLKVHIDVDTLIPDPEPVKDGETKKARSTAQFVAAMFFATIALSIASGTSAYAIRKHLRKGDKMDNALEYPGFGISRTMTDPEAQPASSDTSSVCIDDFSDMTATKDGMTPSKYQAGFDSRNPELDINDEKVEMEDVGLTPVSLPVGHRNSFFSAEKPPRMQANTNVEVKRSSLASAFGMKKWLTPRKSPPKKNNLIDLSDPPESEINFEVAGASKPPMATAAASRKSQDPGANNATMKSTENVKYVTSMHTGNTPLGIPVSFFGRHDSDGRSDATSNHMESMTGSTMSSFFTKMAGRQNSNFTGRRSNQSENGNARHSYKFGATNGNHRDSGNFLDAKNLAAFRDDEENADQAIVETSSTFEERRSVFERKSTSSCPNGRTSSVIGGQPANATQGVAEQRIDKPTREADFEEDSVFTEQSDLDLNELGIETTLGAIPPKFETGTVSSRPCSFVAHEYGSRPWPTSTQSSHASEDMMSTYSKTNTKALAAAEKEKGKASLNTEIKQGDTYDVFAPAGPIGIVVDTSKMGPSVHSLKPTSPMMGLINPGDLIIALDGEDTRNMTAAALTRLMAKKSRQRERKITLLAPNGF